MNTALPVLAHELRLVLREKTIVLVLGLFLAMTALSCLIGYAGSNAVATAYRLSLDQLTNPGSAPPNPFENIPALSLQRNLPIYFFLLGSLLAIILGVSAGLRDRQSRTATLILSRPLRGGAYTGGKIAAVEVALAGCLATSFFLALLLSLLFPPLHLDLGATIRLAIFFGFSWLYLSVFALAGLIGGLRAKSQAMALMGPVSLWVITGFVLPQLTTAIEPTGTLNPVSVNAAGAVNTGIIGQLNTFLGPVSIADTYKRLSSGLLDFGPVTSPSGLWAVNADPVLILLAVLAITTVLAVRAGLRYSPSEDTLV